MADVAVIAGNTHYPAKNLVCFTITTLTQCSGPSVLLLSCKDGSPKAGIPHSHSTRDHESPKSDDRPLGDSEIEKEVSMNISAVRATELLLFRARNRVVNQIFGTLAFSLACLSLGTDSPQTFAFASLFVVLGAGWLRLQRFEPLWSVFREVDHDLLRLRVIWRQLLPAMSGWLFLGFVALGLVTKNAFPM